MYEKEKQHIIDVCNKMIDRNITRETGGNVSVYMREDDVMLITPSGIPYDIMETNDIVEMKLDGKILKIKDGLNPSTEWKMHAEGYKVKPKCNAFIHAHAINSMVISTIYKSLPAIDYLIAFSGNYEVPVTEYAARNHSDTLGMILSKLKKEDLSSIDHIAYTYKPGLIGSLQMGRLFAYGLSFALNKPIYPINHMYAHIFAVEFEYNIKYPAIALIASGGHTQLWKVDSPTKINLLGQTKDDAAGEVFDKISRKLKLGFPGGPAIQNKALESKTPIDFRINTTHDYDFSFSGFKTKIINFIHNLEQQKQQIPIADIAYGVQKAIVENLVDKTKFAIKEFSPKSIILGGGVAANDSLRKKMSDTFGDKALIPSKKYTTDNAAMIAIRSHIINKK